MNVNKLFLAVVFLGLFSSSCKKENEIENESNETGKIIAYVVTAGPVGPEIISGATVNAKLISGEGNVITKISEANGEATFIELPLGEYLIEAGSESSEQGYASSVVDLYEEGMLKEVTLNLQQ